MKNQRGPIIWPSKVSLKVYEDELNNEQSKIFNHTLLMHRLRGRYLRISYTFISIIYVYFIVYTEILTDLSTQ